MPATLDTYLADLPPRTRARMAALLGQLRDWVPEAEFDIDDGTAVLAARMAIGYTSCRPAMPLPCAAVSSNPSVIIATVIQKFAAAKAGYASRARTSCMKKI